MAEGYVMTIPKSLLKKLEQADGLILKIGESSETVRNQFQKSFSAMADSVQPFIENLNLLKNFKNLKLDASIRSSSSAAEKAASNIADMATKLNTVADSPIDRLNNKMASLRTLIQESSAAAQTMQTRITTIDAGSGSISRATMNNASAGQDLRYQVEAQIRYLQLENAEIQSVNSSWQRYIESLTRTSFESERTNNVFRNGTSTLQKQAKAIDEGITGMLDFVKILDKAAKAEEKRNKADKNSSLKQKEKELRAEEQLARAMERSERTILQRISKIRALEAAQRKLVATGKDYSDQIAKIASETNRLQEANHKAAQNTDKLKTSQSKVLDTTSQLKRQLALLFSVSAIEGYIGKLIQVRGEFELQRTALGAIIQNKRMADQVWNKTVNLAVKSPYTVKELVTYTKQLAAYRIETGKLYETTKMLSDVSAGLGVDMGRIILAYGQVKAANYLRASEVRQFTEAGVNVLGELADKYTEIEGRMVSVGEVQDRITHRMVKFGDVEDIFKRLTSAGGIFYNMQELQAETLRGQMSNLTDSLDLMLNKIGEENQDWIKQLANMVKSLIENFDKLIPIIKALAWGFGLNRIAAIGNTQALMNYAKANRGAVLSMKQGITMTKLWTISMISFKHAIKKTMIAMTTFLAKNAILLGLTAIIGAVQTFVHWNDELNRRMDEITKNSEKQAAALLKLRVAYNKVMESSTSSKEPTDDIYNNLKDKVKDLQKIADELGIKIPITLDTNKENFAAEFKKSMNFIQDAIKIGDIVAQQLAESFTEAEWHGLIGENLLTDLKDYEKALNSIGAIERAQLDYMENQLDIINNKLPQAAKKYYNELKEGQKEGELEAQWLNRRIVLIRNANKILLRGSDYQKQALDNLRKTIKLEEKRLKLLGQQDEVSHEITKVYENLVEKLGTDFIKDLQNDTDKQAILRIRLDQEFEKQQLSEATIRIAEHFLGQKFQINLLPQVETVPTEKLFGDFRDAVKVVDPKGFFNLDQITSIIGLEKEWQKIVKETATEKEVVNKINLKSFDISEQIKESEIELAGVRQRMDQQAIVNIEQRLAVLRNAGVLAKQELNLAKQNLALKEKTVKAVQLQYGFILKDNKEESALDKQLKAQLELLKKVGKEYKKNRELFNEPDSKRMIQKDYAEAFKTAKFPKGFLDNMSFDESGIISAMEQVAKTATPKVRQAFENAIADLRGEVTVDVRLKDIEQAQDEIDKAFANYELTITLSDKAPLLDKDTLGQMYGFDPTTLSQLQERMNQVWIEKANERERITAESEGRMATIYKDAATAAASLGDKGVKDYQKQLEKIANLQQKELQSQLDTYIKYLHKTGSEKLRIEMEYREKIAKIPDTFDDTQKEEVKRNLEKEKAEKIDKSTWEEFTGSGYYTAMFENMDNISTTMLQKLMEKLQLLKGELGNLPASDLKAITDQINKIEQEIQERNPYANLGSNLREYISLLGKRKELERQLVQSAAAEDKLSKNVDLKEQEYAASLKEYNIIVKTKGVESEEANAAKKKVSSTYSALNGLRDQLATQKQNTQQIEEQMSKSEKLKSKLGNAANKFASGIQEASSMLSDIQGAFGDMMSQKGNDIMSSAQEIMGGVGGMASGVGRMMSGDWIGGAMQAIGGLAKTIGGIIGIGDKKKEREIQEQIKLVGQLERKYQKLEKAIENAYTIDTLNASYENAEKNLEQQNASYEKMIASEKSKKKVDEARLQEWQDAIDENNQKIADLKAQKIEEFGGFGSAAKMKTAAEDFVSTWLDAYKETGNGLTELEDKWDEYINNVIMKQMALKALEKILKPTMDLIDEAVGEDGHLSTNELAKIRESAEASIPAMEALMQDFADMYDIPVDKAQELANLQTGIQSVTEETADIIAAYMNSIRFFVSEISTDTKRLISSLIDEIIPNPIINELRMQTELIRSINSLIGSVMAPGHPQGGYGVRVFV